MNSRQGVAWSNSKGAWSKAIVKEVWADDFTSPEGWQIPAGMIKVTIFDQGGVERGDKCLPPDQVPFLLQKKVPDSGPPQGPPPTDTLPTVPLAPPPTVPPAPPPTGSAARAADGAVPSGSTVPAEALTTAGAVASSGQGTEAAAGGGLG